MTRYIRPPLSLFPVLIMVLGGAARLGAQGSASLQGFGYPPGELSTRAEGTAGAIAEIDGASPINPAALAIRAQGEVYAQYDPELRHVTGPTGSSNTTTTRFPNFGAILPFMGHWVAGLSVSTFLDRTWETQLTSQQTIGADAVTSTEIARSQGGITDIRLALAYAFNSRIRVGVGANGYGGSNNVALTEEFADTLRYRDISQSTTLNYSGTAASGGVEVDLLPSLSVALSGRTGGAIKMYTGDTLLSRGRIPDNYAGSISFQGIPGTLLAVRMARDLWSSLTPLSTAGAQAVDATDISVGAESAGPRFGSAGEPIVIRLGVRRRTLPFLVGTTQVRETSFGGGLGIPLAQNRVVLDMSLLRSNRTGVSGVAESAYGLSLGLRVHP